MDLENTQNNSLTKLPLLKQGEYDTWRLRIESYIQLQDYTLWEIIEEGNSFKPVARATTNKDGTSTTIIPSAVTAKQKILKKNDLKARSILMMTLPSERLLTFNKHKDAKSLFEAIEARFGGENITPEELNLKFLRSLPTEWGMHVVVWRNKSDLGSISFDDLYNNFKIVEPEVKRKQTHEDDLDEMDLKWQLALLSMKARKFYQRIGKKIIINGSDTAKSKGVKRTGTKVKIAQEETVNMEIISSPKLSAIDGTGFDWSYMADEEAPTNFAFMAFSDSKVQNNKTCSKTCLKNFEDLKSRYDKLRIELNKSECDLDSYKKGLASVEEQLIFYNKNESMLCDQIVVLKSDPLTGLFAPPSIDLSNSRLKKFKQPEFKGYGVKVNKGASENVSKEIKKTSDALIIEDWVSDSDEDEIVVL
ncbi:hypothetical protein Tco_0337258 [Tanacetum coccineum]